MRQSVIYIVPDCDGGELCPEIYNVIQQSIQNDISEKQPEFLCCDTVPKEKFPTLPEYVMSLCRKHNLLRNERATMLSLMDQMVAVQLCLAEKNKEEFGDYDVESSTVIHQSNVLIRKKLSDSNPDIDMTQSPEVWFEKSYSMFLNNCNQVDLCDVLDLLISGCEKNDEIKSDVYSSDLVILGLPSHQIQKCMLKFLCRNRDVRKITLETSLESNSDVTVQTVPSSLEEIQLNTNLDVSSNKTWSITESYVRMVLLSYLELIVNTRSELALARVLNVPNRDLTHEAFTELKREAKKKNMTMYQTAVSYILKIRLGGKGYAPDPNHPLLQFVKGLGEFVDLMQKLQNVIEEETNTRKACRKLVIIIKKELLKSNDTKLRPGSIETVSTSLLETVTLVIDQTEKMKMTSPDKSVSNGGSFLGRKTLKALRHITDKLLTQQDQSQSLDYLCDGFSSQKTPIRFPSLLSQFRSPEEDTEEDKDQDHSLSLSERLIKRKSEIAVESIKSYQASYDWAMPVHDAGLSKQEDISMTQSEVVVLPSKTLVHPASASKSGYAKKILESMRDQENVGSGKITKSLNCTTKPLQKESVNISSKPEVDQSSQKPNETSEEMSVIVEKGGKKRKSTESTAPAKKKSKTEPKSCRRKLLPQVKGQQQLSMFFRV